MHTLCPVYKIRGAGDRNALDSGLALSLVKASQSIHWFPFQKKGVVTLLGCLLLINAGCKEEADPTCEDLRVATIRIDGADVCLRKAEVVFFSENTPQAAVRIVLRERVLEGAMLDATFRLPVSGRAYDTPYPVMEGEYYAGTHGSDHDILSGTYTIKEGGSIGEFALTSQNRFNPSEQSTITGIIYQIVP